MKKRLLLILTFTLWSSACFADQYVLVMSKNDCVCHYMLKIYNEDLKKYGEIAERFNISQPPPATVARTLDLE
jgi:hypothetical protein